MRLLTLAAVIVALLSAGIDSEDEEDYEDGGFTGLFLAQYLHI